MKFEATTGIPLTPVGQINSRRPVQKPTRINGFRATSGRTRTHSSSSLSTQTVEPSRPPARAAALPRSRAAAPPRHHAAAQAARHRSSAPLRHLRPATRGRNATPEAANALCSSRSTAVRPNAASSPRASLSPTCRRSSSDVDSSRYNPTYM
jgi:hypothetical protein